VPPQVETRITCPLSAMQTFWYRRLLTRDSKMLTNIEAEDKGTNKDKDKEVNVRLCSSLVSAEPVLSQNERSSCGWDIIAIITKDDTKAVWFCCMDAAARCLVAPA